MEFRAGAYVLIENRAFDKNTESVFDVKTVFLLRPTRKRVGACMLPNLHLGTNYL